MGYVNSLLGRNERIVFVTRQHWLVIVRTALQDAILLVIIIAAAIWLKKEFENNVFILLSVLAIIPIVHWVVRYLNWNFAKFLITNRRVMEVRGVINKYVSDSSLEKVNDVVLEQSMLGRILDYGMVEIITGSDIGVNIFRYMSQPVRFKTEMLNQKEGMTKRDSAGAGAKHRLPSGPAREEIPELIAKLAELHRRGFITTEEFEAKKADLLKRL